MNETAGSIAAWLALTVGVVSGLLLYMLPSIIAVRRCHHQVGPIVIVNVLLGACFGVGWIVALAWSLSAVRRPPVA